MARQRVRVASAGRSKYGAVATTVDGIRFHSAKEAKRYGELKLLILGGKIRGLALQPVYVLNVPRIGTGLMQKIGEYRGDFRYEEYVSTVCCSQTIAQWQHVVEDVKGFKTPLYKWKKRHVEAQYGIEIREV